MTRVFTAIPTHPLPERVVAEADYLAVYDANLGLQHALQVAEAALVSAQEREAASQIECEALRDRLREAYERRAQDAMVDEAASADIAKNAAQITGYSMYNGNGVLIDQQPAPEPALVEECQHLTRSVHVNAEGLISSDERCDECGADTVHIPFATGTTLRTIAPDEESVDFTPEERIEARELAAQAIEEGATAVMVEKQDGLLYPVTLMMRGPNGEHIRFEGKANHPMCDMVPVEGRIIGVPADD